MNENIFPGYSVDQIISRLIEYTDYNVIMDEARENDIKEFSRAFYSTWNFSIVDLFEAAYKRRIQPQAIYCLLAKMIDDVYSYHDHEYLDSL